MTHTISRRSFIHFVGAGSALALGAPLGAPGAVQAAMLPAADCTAFPLPARTARPRFRWWWPGGAIDPAQVRREVDAIADAGFGGFEIADVRDSITAPMDPKLYGWGSARWIAGVEAALETAARRGLSADLTVGAHWPTGMPGTMPDDDAASKELVHGGVTIRGGEVFAAAVPAPLGPPAGMRPISNPNPPVTPRLLAVQAMRIADTSGGVMTLAPDSLIDLTRQVTGGRLTWQAPAGGSWRVIAFWTRGTGQIQNMFDRSTHASPLTDPVPYVVDIFGKAGAQACIDYWNSRLLPPRTRSLLRQVGGSIFEDSLEVSAAQHWSPDLPGEFERRRGYRLEPWLTLLVGAPTDPDRKPFSAVPPAPYALAGVERSRLIHDFDQTLGEMYVDNRIKPLQAWANSLGMSFRVQCIGGVVDSGAAAAVADIPEGDNSCDLDGFRVLAAGRDVGGRRILSDEAATFVGGSAHVADWKLMLSMVQRDYAGGVNQVILHGFSYADAPGARWPGFSAFGRAIGDDWGPRSPHWEMAPDMSAYLSRLQAVLQSGTSRSDVAILHQGGGTGAHFKDQGLAQAGYTYQFPSVALLQHPNAIVRDKRLVADGPAYRALVIDRQQSMSLDTVERIAAYAQAGLPVFVVGEAPRRARGLRDAQRQDMAVKAAVERLLASNGVVRVGRASELPAALRAAGVRPTFGFSRPANMLGVYREDGASAYAYLLNDSDDRTEQTVSLPGTRRPFRIDLWSGAITPVAVYSVRDGRTSIPLSLAADETAVFVLADAPGFCARPPATHAVRADAALRYAGGKLLLCAPAPGRYAVELHDGRMTSVECTRVPAATTLSAWTLQVQDWRPGKGATDTRKLTRRLTLAALKPWLELPQLRGVSGVGRYATDVDLGARWSSRQGAWLDLGVVGGSFRVQVNGVALPALNQFDTRIDVGQYLRAGKNRIEVIVATTLNNRLMAEGIESDMAGTGKPADPVPAGETPPPPPAAPEGGGPPPMPKGAAPPGMPRKEQAYGLIGPVRLVPYELIPVPGATDRKETSE